MWRDFLRWVDFISQHYLDFFFIFFSNKNRFINDTLAILDFLIMLLLSTLRGQRRKWQKKISKTPRISMIYTKLHIIIIFYAIIIIFSFQGRDINFYPKKIVPIFCFVGNNGAVDNDLSLVKQLHDGEFLCKKKNMLVIQFRNLKWGSPIYFNCARDAKSVRSALIERDQWFFFFLGALYSI